MSEKSVLSLRVNPTPSKSLAAIILVTHVLAFVSGFASTLPLWLSWVLAIAVLCSLVIYLNRYYLHYMDGLAIGYQDSGSWYLDDGGDETLKLQLLPSSVVTPWVVILNFKSANKTTNSFVICRDSLDAESFRKLRVVLTITKIPV